MEDNSELDRLLKQRQEISNKISDILQNKNKYYSGMSAEVKDENPYRYYFLL